MFEDHETLKRSLDIATGCEMSRKMFFKTASKWMMNNGSSQRFLEFGPERITWTDETVTYNRSITITTRAGVTEELASFKRTWPFAEKL